MKGNKELLEKLISCIVDNLPFDKFTIYQMLDTENKTYNNVVFFSKDKTIAINNATNGNLKEKLKKIMEWLHREYPQILIAFHVDNVFICGDKMPEYPWDKTASDTADIDWTYDWDTTAGGQHYDYIIWDDVSDTSKTTSWVGTALDNAKAGEWVQIRVAGVAKKDVK